MFSGEFQRFSRTKYLGDEAIFDRDEEGSKSSPRQYGGSTRRRVGVRGVFELDDRFPASKGQARI